MITSYSRGHKIIWDGTNWRHEDDNSKHDDSRACITCGRRPTKEGYDACLGFIKHSTSACCGHGVDKPYVFLESSEMTEYKSRWFYTREERFWFFAILVCLIMVAGLFKLIGVY